MHLRANPRNLESVARSPIPTLESGGREALTLQFPDHLLGCKLGVRFGLEIIRRHEASCRLASDEKSGMRMRRYSRAPAPRSALVGNNRKLRYFGQIASDNRPRASYAAMSTPAGAIAGAATARVRLIGVAARQGIPLDAIRCPRDTPIWKLEAALKCRSCKKGRYAPPVHMIKLTQEREIAPYLWTHPDDDGRR
jgi:hypothetical protein